MSGVTKRIESFAHRAVHGKHAALLRVELHHYQAGFGSSVVDQWTFDDDAPATVHILAAELEARADGHAEGLSGVQSYRAVAYFKDEGPRTTERIGLQSDTWRVRGVANDDDELFGPSEPANRAGQLAASMRHTEGAFRLALGAMTQSHQQQGQTIEKQQAFIDRLLNGYFETIKAGEELISQRQQRDIEQQESVEKLRERKEAWELFTIIAPVVANRVARKFGVPLALPEKGGTNAPMDETVMRLMGTLKSEQLAGLQRILTPEQFIGVAELYEDARQRYEEREKAKTAAAELEAVRGKNPTH